jgi:hypothetical protein
MADVFVRQPPADWGAPDWDSASIVHEWKSYISEEMRQMWDSFSDAQKIAIARNAEDQAAFEEWD